MKKSFGHRKKIAKFVVLSLYYLPPPSTKCAYRSMKNITKFVMRPWKNIVKFRCRLLWKIAKIFSWTSGKISLMATGKCREIPQILPGQNITKFIKWSWRKIVRKEIAKFVVHSLRNSRKLKKTRNSSIGYWKISQKSLISRGKISKIRQSVAGKYSKIIQTIAGKFRDIPLSVAGKYREDLQSNAKNKSWISPISSKKKM